MKKGMNPLYSYLTVVVMMVLFGPRKSENVSMQNMTTNQAARKGMDLVFSYLPMVLMMVLFVPGKSEYLSAPDMKTKQALCPRGWIPSISGTCYKFYMKRKLRWCEARRACKAMNSWLANLETMEEIDWLKSYRHEHNLRYNLWIGGRRLECNNKWYWISNDEDIQAIEDFDWAERHHGNSQCLELTGSVWYWASRTSDWYRFDDVPCNYQRYFMCERNALE